MNQSIDRQMLMFLIAIVNLSLLYCRCFLLALLTQCSFQVLLHDECTDGYTIDSSESTILYIHGDGNLWVIHRSKAHKGRVVLTLILGRTGLAAYLDVGQVGSYSSTIENGLAHTLHDGLVVSLLYHRVFGETIEAVENLALHLLDDEWRNVVATVGNSSAEIGNL